MFAELGMVPTDPGDRLADGPGHTSSSAFGCGRCSSMPAAQANGAGEPLEGGSRVRCRLARFARRRRGRALARCRRRSRRDVEIGVFGAGVEHSPASPSSERGTLAAVDLRNAAGFGDDEVLHVVLPV